MFFIVSIIAIRGLGFPSLTGIQLVPELPPAPPSCFTPSFLGALEVHSGRPSIYDVFGDDSSPSRWKSDLKLRIVQHNIRTVATYYKQIYTKRLAELIGLNEAQAERNVAGVLVVRAVDVEATVERIATGSVRIFT